jgi:hypothetical protein
VPIINQFIDREEDMDALEIVLLPRAHSDRRQVMILHGMGGIGKTQLAVEFAQKHQKVSSSIFFVDADSKDSLLHSFLAIFRRITVGDQSREDNLPNSAAQLEEMAKEVLIWFDSEGNDRYRHELDVLHVLEDWSPMSRYLPFFLPFTFFADLSG